MLLQLDGDKAGDRTGLLLAAGSVFICLVRRARFLSVECNLVRGAVAESIDIARRLFCLPGLASGLIVHHELLPVCSLGMRTNR